MNEDLQLILKKLDHLEVSTNRRFDQIDKRFDGVEERLTIVENRLDGVDKRLDGMDKRFDGIDRRLDHLETDQHLIKEQLNETNQIVRAIHARQEVADAKIESLTLDVRELQGKSDKHQKTLDKIFEKRKSIYEMLGDHDVSIRTLEKKLG